MDRLLKNRLIVVISVIAFLGAFVILTIYSFKYKTGYALISTVTVAISITPFFLSLEMRKIKARDIVPIAVMAALGAVGRIAFMAIPSVKPTTAIVIITGMVFGPQAGFLTGAVSALASNFYFGQGPWTPWQMLAWGLCGLLAGLFKNIGLIRGTKTLVVFGFIVSMLFGVIMNCWQVIGFVNPITLGAVLATFAASLSFDITHALSTSVFLLLLGNIWLKKLERIKRKFGILQT
ncbi:MAG: ECF transporter S component [Eubacteriales bacterium]